MRIIHATECAASGTLDVIVALAHELAAAGAHQLIVYCPRSETPTHLEQLFPDNVEFLRVRAASGMHLRFAWEFAAVLDHAVRSFEPDCVHLHSSKAGFAGRFAHAVAPWPCRVLYSPHGLSFLDPDRAVSNSIFRMVEHLAAWTAATPVACSRSEADLLSELSGRDALLLENPVEERFFSIARTPATPSKVVSVGRLSRQKAPERFAALARQVRPHAPDTRFIWIGDGDTRYKTTLIESGCEVTGWRSREEVAHLLSTAAVYVQTSRWEGLPISVIQALAVGLPCVVYGCVGNRDAVTNGSTGYVATSVAEMGEKILTLLRHSSLREQLGVNARSEAARRFGLSAFGARARQLYGLLHEQQATPEVPAFVGPGMPVLAQRAATV